MLNQGSTVTPEHGWRKQAVTAWILLTALSSFHQASHLRWAQVKADCVPFHCHGSSLDLCCSSPKLVAPVVRLTPRELSDPLCSLPSKGEACGVKIGTHVSLTGLSARDTLISSVGGGVDRVDGGTHRPTHPPLWFDNNPLFISNTTQEVREAVEIVTSTQLVTLNALGRWRGLTGRYLLRGFSMLKLETQLSWPLHLLLTNL